MGSFGTCAMRAHARNVRKKLLVADRDLPGDNRLATIPGIGNVTAQRCSPRFVLDIGRFRSPIQLVKSFGVLPTKVASGAESSPN